MSYYRQSFRVYGGINCRPVANYVSSRVLTASQSQTTATIGQENSKEAYRSHIDMLGHAIYNVGSIYFSDGTLMTTANNTTTDTTAAAATATTTTVATTDTTKPPYFSNTHTYFINNTSIDATPQTLSWQFSEIVNGWTSLDNILSTPQFIPIRCSVPDNLTVEAVSYTFVEPGNIGSISDVFMTVEWIVSLQFSKNIEEHDYSANNDTVESITVVTSYLFRPC